MAAVKRLERWLGVGPSVVRALAIGAALTAALTIVALVTG